MAEELRYDDAITALRKALMEARTNARAFAVHARARPRLLSARTWAELAEIELLLARRLEQALSRELRVAPWTPLDRVRTWLGGLFGGLRPESRLVGELWRATLAHPVERWRTGTPQLEESLWPFFVSRTRHLANALALAQNEPAPYPQIFWHPGRRQFQS